MKKIEILGNGQIWDLKAIDKQNPELSFEDLFSGRALEKMLNDFEADCIKRYNRRIFSDYSKKGRLRGIVLTEALLSKEKQKINCSKRILKELANNGAKGIIALNRGRGFKRWTEKEKNFWKKIDNVIIGAGVSKGYTGKLLVASIRNCLKKEGLGHIKVFQAKFPGKEAGFLGAIVNLLCRVFKDGRSKKEAVIGVDLGRDKTGVGFAVVDIEKEKILEKNNRPWDSLIVDKTPGRHNSKIFLDSKEEYSKKEILSGKKIRKAILKKIVDLVQINIKKIKAKELSYSRHIGISVPGQINSRGDIVGSTDYLPFFRLKDNFHFKKEMEGLFLKKGLSSFKISVINDGIAAGLANAYFDSKIKRGKVIFLGVGSGLGGFAGRIG